MTTFSWKFFCHAEFDYFSAAAVPAVVSGRSIVLVLFFDDVFVRIRIVVVGHGLVHSFATTPAVNIGSGPAPNPG